MRAYDWAETIKCVAEVTPSCIRRMLRLVALLRCSMDRPSRQHQLFTPPRGQHGSRDGFRHWTCSLECRGVASRAPAVFRMYPAGGFVLATRGLACSHLSITGVRTGFDEQRTPRGSDDNLGWSYGLGCSVSISIGPTRLCGERAPRAGLMTVYDYAECTLPATASSAVVIARQQFSSGLRSIHEL